MPGYEPTYHKTGGYQSWYRVTRCKCVARDCWAVVDVYSGLRAGSYSRWEYALRTAIKFNSGMVRPDPKQRIR